MSFPTAPTLSPALVVTLQSGMTTLVLPAPEYNNTHSLALTRIQRESRDRTQQIYIDPMWPRIESFDWVIKNLSTAQRDAYLSFIESTLGLPVTLIDYEGITWTVLIVEPQKPITQKGPGCQFAISLTMQLISSGIAPATPGNAPTNPIATNPGYGNTPTDPFIYPGWSVLLDWDTMTDYAVLGP